MSAKFFVFGPFNFAIDGLLLILIAEEESDRFEVDKRRGEESLELFFPIILPIHPDMPDLLVFGALDIFPCGLSGFDSLVSMLVLLERESGVSSGLM